MRDRVHKFWLKLSKHGAMTTASVSLIGTIVGGGISLCNSNRALEQSREALNQTRTLTESQQDLDLLVRFADFHFASDRRYRFTVYIVDKMQDPGFRRGLRRFILWETMSRNFKDSKPVSRFDKDHDDWAVLGEAAWNLRSEWSEAHEHSSFNDWWCDQKRTAVRRWPKHEQHVNDLYDYLDDWYLDDKHFKQQALRKFARCGATKK